MTVNIIENKCLGQSQIYFKIYIVADTKVLIKSNKISGVYKRSDKSNMFGGSVMEINVLSKASGSGIYFLR